MEKHLSKSEALKGELTIAADKSISHRAVIFSALARGQSIISNFLQAADTFSSCRCLEQLGVKFKRDGSMLRVAGRGLEGLNEPNAVLDCGNSGTTMRLLAGLLCARPFFTVLSGDKSLNKRPMERIIKPLTAMGANIQGRDHGNYPPLALRGSSLHGVNYHLLVASAQVKSAILLAALSAEGPTTVSELQRSRDHSERMLAAMGADLEVKGLEVKLNPGRELQAQEFIIPGDISSAAYFIVAAAIVPGSEVYIRDVGINPTRAGIIEVMERMGANIKVENRRIINGEPAANLLVSSSQLKAIEISGDIIPRLIDELPVIAVAMAAAEGISAVSDAGELRVKETDRIAAIASELTKMGIKIETQEDGFIIEGRPELIKGAQVDSHGDHRIAMSLAAASLIADGETTITNSQAVDISFPDFWEKLKRLTD